MLKVMLVLFNWRECNHHSAAPPLGRIGPRGTRVPDGWEEGSAALCWEPSSRIAYKSQSLNSCYRRTNADIITATHTRTRSQRQLQGL